MALDKKTGEIIENHGKTLLFNDQKAEEDAKFDGFYCFASSELGMPASQIIEIYNGLSDIEDNSKVSKNDLDIRPVRVTLKDHVHTYMLTCFITVHIFRKNQEKFSA